MKDFVFAVMIKRLDMIQHDLQFDDLCRILYCFFHFKFFQVDVNPIHKYRSAIIPGLTAKHVISSDMHFLPMPERQGLPCYIIGEECD